MQKCTAVNRPFETHLYLLTPGAVTKGILVFNFMDMIGKPTPFFAISRFVTALKNRSFSPQNQENGCIPKSTMQWHDQGSLLQSVQSKRVASDFMLPIQSGKDPTCILSSIKNGRQVKMLSPYINLHEIYLFSFIVSVVLHQTDWSVIVLQFVATCISLMCMYYLIYKGSPASGWFRSNILRSFSLLPVSSLLPSLENDTDFTICLCANVCNSSPFTASHSFLC